MKLIKMTLQNFRQYYGTQEIAFSHSNNQNVTILFGENGKGKTGIYRAVMFALFGAKYISQDNKNDVIHLVNLKALEENNVNKGKVTIEFSHESEKYILTRSINGIRAGKIIKETDGEVELKKIDENGNADPNIYREFNEVSTIINNIMNPEIKDFFLFDAEKIDTLAKSDNDSRKEVKTAIYSLMHLDKLTKAHTIIRTEMTSIRTIVTTNMKNSNINSHSSKIEEYKNSIKQNEDRIVQIEKDIFATQELIASQELIREQNSEILKNKEKITSKQIEINKAQSELETINGRFINNSFKKIPFLMMNVFLESNLNMLNNFIGEDKINIPLEVIKTSLDENKCLVCNSDLEENPTNRSYVEFLVNSNRFTDTYTKARELNTMVTNSTLEYDSNLEDFHTNIKEYYKSLQLIDELKTEMKTLDDEIIKHAKNDLNLSDIQNNIDSEKERLYNLKRKVDDLKSENNDLKIKENELNEEISKILKSEKSNTFDRKLLEVYNNIDKDISHISSEFTESIRKLLGRYTTEIFKELIDVKDKDVISVVQINKKFEIIALNHSGIEITQDISQGQRQILALSFITALAKLAVRDETSDKIDYPLFMDSPFNRLSGINRDNLIGQIPNLTSQWVLLLTDTELTHSEEKVFKTNNTIGNWYRINQIEEYHSEIEQVPLNENLATRGI